MCAFPLCYLFHPLPPQGHIDPQPSARDTARSSAEALPPPDPEGGTLINRIEHLNDLAHTVDVFRVLLLMWLVGTCLCFVFVSVLLHVPAENHLRSDGIWCHDDVITMCECVL